MSIINIKGGETMSNIGQNIKIIRHSRNMSQKLLSQKSSVAYGYIADIESGKCNNPSIKILERLSQALEVPIIQLLEEPREQVIVN